jgi:uncharacterized surface protein with fasciclin (FAS1) repeats
MFVFLIVALVGLGAFVPAHAQSGKSRIRVAHFSGDAGGLAVFIDGKAAIMNMPTGIISHYGSFEPGSHTITFAPTGKDESAALAPMVTQETAADTDYTIALIGNVADKSVASLVIDDTQAKADAVAVGDIAAAETAGTLNYTLIVNAMSDVKSLSIEADGVAVMKDMAFGQYQTIKGAPVTYKASILFDGKSLSAAPVETFNLPAAYTVSAFTGTAKQFGVPSVSTTDLDLPTYLKTYSDASVKLAEKVGTFEGFVSALEVSKSTEVLTAANNVNTVFVPSDAAFKALGKDTVDKLFGDPTLLGKLLAYHVVPDTIFLPNLIKSTSLKTVNGADLAISIDAKGIALNASSHLILATGEMRFPNSLVMYLIDQVVFPPTK